MWVKRLHPHCKPMRIAPCLRGGLGARSSCSGAGNSQPAHATAQPCLRLSARMALTCISPCKPHSSLWRAGLPKRAGWAFRCGEEGVCFSMPVAWMAFLPHLKACAPKATVFAFSFLPRVPCHEGASEQESREERKAPALLLNHPAGKAGTWGSQPVPWAPGPFPELEGKRRSVVVSQSPICIGTPFSHVPCKQP